MPISNVLLNFMRQLANSSESLTPAGKERVHKFFDEIEKTLRPSEHIKILTYSDALGYFRTHAPKHQKVSQGVIIREPVSNGVHVIEIFLDKNEEIIPEVNNNKLPYGRRLFADHLDQELEEAFEGGNMILVK